MTQLFLMLNSKVLDIGEKDMDDKSKEKANAEYEKLRSLYVHKEIQHSVF